jgi:DNA-binding response OmpR family regulator
MIPQPKDNMVNYHKWLVLLVENEPYLQQSLVQALNAAFRGSVETQVSSTPEEALALANMYQFDLVVTEHNLTGMSGVEMIAALRRKSPDLPAVLLSEVNPDLISTRTLSMADGFLAKPFELTKFFKVIKSVMRQHSENTDEALRNSMNGSNGSIGSNGSNGSNESSPEKASSNGRLLPEEENQPDEVKILIVEDDSGLLYIYQKALGRAGYKVVKALNLAEARPLIENNVYDLMICDIQLGRERGTDLIEQYGKEFKEKGTQIIMVSSYGEYRHITDDMGIDFFLEKPISIASLITLIDRLTNKSEQSVAANA